MAVAGEEEHHPVIRFYMTFGEPHEGRHDGGSGGVLVLQAGDVGGIEAELLGQGVGDLLGVVHGERQGAFMFISVISTTTA